MLMGKADTEITADVLREVFENEGTGVYYILPAHDKTPERFITRVRVKLARARKSVRRSGKRTRHFQLSARLVTGLSETPDTIAVLLSVIRRESDKLADALDKALANETENKDAN